MDLEIYHCAIIGKSNILSSFEIFEAAQSDGTEVTAILITDGHPTSPQSETSPSTENYNICDNVMISETESTELRGDGYDAGDRLDALGVVGVLIAVGSEFISPFDGINIVGCWPTDTRYIYSTENFAALESLAVNRIAENACPGHTPFDGRYMRTTEMSNGQYVTLRFK